MIRSYVATLTGPATPLSAAVGGGYDDIPYRQLLVEPAAANLADILLQGTAFGEYQAAVRASGALGYWRLDETSGTTFADSSGNGHTLTQAGGVTVGATGQVGKAAIFDGTNDTAATSSGVNAWFGQPGLSIEAWVFNPAWAAAHEQILSLGNIGIYLSVDTGRLIMSIHVGSQFTNRVPAGPNVLPANTWTHVVGTWASGQPIRLYINGVEVAGDTPTARSGLLSNSANLFLGSFAGSALWYSGTLDEVSLYLRQLSATEIATHYRLSARTIGAFTLAPGAKRLTLGPFDEGPLKLSHLYGSGTGALTILGVPF